MEKPKGFLGKNWNKMSKKELLNVIFHLWEEKEEIEKRLESYEKNVMNIPID